MQSNTADNALDDIIGVIEDLENRIEELEEILEITTQERDNLEEELYELKARFEVD
ncbi:MAG: hypothetical protein GYA36_16720 [Veillonellaceae bacterium]|jgi:prefoldin subunit 5|nr:hypothetical protein [Veillonellaceae bacterium]